jgi:hypothetical protein
MLEICEITHTLEENLNIGRRFSSKKTFCVCVLNRKAQAFQFVFVLYVITITGDSIVS